MKEYSNGKRKIYATGRAYEVLYKQQGFKEVREIEKVEEKKDAKKTTTKKK